MKRAALILVLLALGLGSGWRLFLHTDLRHLHDLQATHAQLEAQLSNADVTRDSLTKTQAVLARQWREYQTVRTRLPAQADMSRLLDIITANAFGLGVNLRHLAPGPIEAQAYLKRQAVAIEISGDWSALTRFLERIAQQPRLLNIEQLTWQRLDSETHSHEHIVTLRLQAYWAPLRPPEPKALGAAVITETARSTHPAQLPTLAKQPNPFQIPVTARAIAANSELEYLGRIHKGEQVWMLLRQKNGEVIRVKNDGPLPVSLGE